MINTMEENTKKTMNNQISNYFGFDLGDGESAVAWAFEGGNAAPMMLELSGRKNILTALAKSESGQDFIGEQALVLGTDQLDVCFKSRFIDEPMLIGPMIVRFARCVLKGLTQSGKLNDPACCAFFVGCPTGWPDNVRKQYRALLEEAGLPNVNVVSESRAAFMFARESGEITNREQAMRPSLVVDAGSSTTDYTFIDQLRAHPIKDFGENRLGAGLIDRLLLDRNVDRHPKRDRIKHIFAACPTYRARAELEARRVKEMHFSREGSDAWRMPCESSVKIYYDHPPITLDIVCDPSDMDELLNMPVEQLNGKSYLTTYKESLKDIKKALKQSMPELVLLTGGASRMQFMRAMVEDVFPDAQIILGAEPEFAIARGLCYALRVDMRAKRLEEDVRKLMESDNVERVVMDAVPKLLQSIAPVIADAMIENDAPKAFRRWKHGDIKRICDMSQAMESSIAQSLEQGELADSLETVVEAWLKGIRPELEALTDPICIQCHLPLTSLRIKIDAPVDGLSLDVDASRMLPMNLIQTITDVAVASIVAGIMGGGGIALFMAGPIGWAISFVVGFIASRVGTTFAKKQLESADIPAIARRLFPTRMFKKSLASRRSDMIWEIETQLGKRMNGPDGLSDAFVATVSGAIDNQLGELAHKARLLIR